MAVAGSAASSRVLQAWLEPPEPPLEPPTKPPCVPPAPVVAGRRQRPNCHTPGPPARRGQVQSTLPWMGNSVPPHRAPRHGGGGGHSGMPGGVYFNQHDTFEFRTFELLMHASRGGRFLGLLLG